MSNEIAYEIAAQIVDGINEILELDYDDDILSSDEILNSSAIRQLLDQAEYADTGDYVSYDFVFDRNKSEQIAFALTDLEAGHDSYIYKRDSDVKVRARLEIEKVDNATLGVQFEIFSDLGSAEVYIVDRGNYGHEAMRLNDDNIMRESPVTILEHLFSCSTLEVLSAIIEQGSQFDLSVPIYSEDAREILESEDEDQVYQIIDDAIANGMIDFEKIVTLVYQKESGLTDLTEQNLSNSVDCQFEIDLDSIR